MKKTFATITLALVLTFGATFANAGILIGDRWATPAPCSASKDGILIGDRSAIGILIGDFAAYLEGILIGDKTATGCTAKGGIMVSDRSGILIGD